MSKPIVFNSLDALTYFEKYGREAPVCGRCGLRVLDRHWSAKFHFGCLKKTLLAPAPKNLGVCADCKEPILDRGARSKYCFACAKKRYRWY